MAKPSPLQQVKERFGSKEELAKQLIDVLDRDEDLDDEEFERRVHTASNKQLLRLHHVHQVVTSRFGGKEGLVDALVKLKFPKGNDPYRTSLLAKRATVLLEDYHASARRR